MPNHSTIIRTYKYRLYPNKTQTAALETIFSYGWRVWNDALHMRQQHYAETGESIGLYDLRDYWCELRHKYPDSLGLISAKSMDALIRRLDKAYKAFFRRVKKGEAAPGFPKPKQRRNFTSLEYKNGSGAKFMGCKLRLMNVGDIKVNLHRPLPDGAKVKYIIVKQEKRGHWYACLQCEFEERALPDDMKEGAVGIDVGIAYLLALSNGDTLDNPRWYRESLQKRRRLNHSLSRKTRGSYRWKQVRQQIAKHENSIKQKRWYFWHTVTDRLTRDYSFIAIEDLSPDFMIANKQLAMSASDAAWSTFKQMLEYKCEERGVRLEKVKAAYTSQTCSACGSVDKDNRKTQAEFICEACGHNENADINAAKNILRKGLAQAGIDEAVLKTD